VPVTSNGPMAWYMRAMQTLKNARGGGDAADGILIPRVVDLGFFMLTTAGAGSLLLFASGLPMQTVMAVLGPLGIGSLAVSLAAKNLVQNIIAGMLIFLNRAFTEGEEIHSTDGKTKGRVSKIGWINTRINKTEGSPLVIPNSQLVDNGIINIQRRDYWLLEKTFPLIMPSFGRLGEVVEAMDAVLKQKVAESTKRERPVPLTLYEDPICFFDGFGHQGANVRARAWLDGSLARHEYYKVQSDILLALNNVALSFAGNGIGFETHLVGGRTDAPAGHH